MPQKLLLKIAIWSGGVEGKGLFDEATPNLMGRQLALMAALKRAKSEWLNLEKHEPSVLKIFVAPENLFVEPEAGTGERATSFDNFRALVNRATLARLSQQGLLFIPGTVAWWKPHIKPPNLRAQTPEKNRLEKLEGKLERFKSRIEESYTIFGNGTISGGLRGAVNGEITDVNDKVGRLRAEEKNRAVHLAKTVAYVYYNGREIKKYHKQAENRGFGGEVTGKSHSGRYIEFIQGYRDGLFEVRMDENIKLQCGLEICADHGNRALTCSGKVERKGDGSNEVKRAELQLQFILSDRIGTIREAVAVKEGGYVVHASTNPHDSGVYDHEANRLSERKEVDLTDSLYGKLRYYLQTLEL